MLEMIIPFFSRNEPHSLVHDNIDMGNWQAFTKWTLLLIYLQVVVLCIFDVNEEKGDNVILASDQKVSESFVFGVPLLVTILGLGQMDIT